MCDEDAYADADNELLKELFELVHKALLCGEQFHQLPVIRAAQ